MGCNRGVGQTYFKFLADYLVSELQGLRLILSHSYSVKQQTKPLELSLSSELHLLCKLLAVPTSEEVLKSHPQRALAQIKAKVRLHEGNEFRMVAPIASRRPETSTNCPLQVGKLLEKLPADQLRASVPLLDSNLSNAHIMVHTAVLPMLSLEFDP
jgi:hypothetical protein